MVIGRRKSNPGIFIVSLLNQPACIHQILKGADRLSLLQDPLRGNAFFLQIFRHGTGLGAAFIGALTRLKSDTHYCSRCHCISDTPLCPICSSPKRNQKIICVVENIQEVMAIENTGRYNGLYHVLGGVISPLDGIGIGDLTISQLIDRVAAEQTEEVILALPTTMEGDTTNIYIDRQLKQFPDLKVTTIARGIAIGDNLEYADEITLGRSIVNRVPFGVI